jgi:hypothetical protein
MGVDYSRKVRSETDITTTINYHKNSVRMENINLKNGKELCGF